jgi:glycosyltransferase involved in cell wall biosynthesis
MIVRTCKEHQIQVLNVQMNSGSTEFLLPYFKRELPPLVVTFHLAYAAGTSLYTTMFGLAWKASLSAARKYDKIVLVDPAQKQFFTRSGVSENRLTVVPNGVDTDLFVPSTSTHRDDMVDFVFVGRLSYDKGVDILLKAFHLYHSENRKSRLTLIGDGMLKAQLSGLADHAVRWLGTQNHDEVPRFLQHADVFVIPQNIGGLGMSVLEAMSCGLPVITTAIGETSRLLSEEEGVLVKPHDVESVVDAMRLLGSDERLRRSMGTRCRTKILRDYSWKSQIHRLEQVYEEAVSVPRD